MTKNYLFPARFQKFGWFLLVPFGLMFFLFAFGPDSIKERWPMPVFALVDEVLFQKTSWFNFTSNCVFDEVAFIGLIVSLLLIAFSKEKDEDEFISQIRLNSLVWALLINYVILILAELFIYGMPFLNVLYFNLIMILVLFVIKFRIELYKLKTNAGNEK
ncbi:MAG: hypothetical protein JZU53_03045 [Paludibacter sp.]|nr:hypothetical protein [Paludibacter sp.]